MSPLLYMVGHLISTWWYSLGGCWTFRRWRLTGWSRMGSGAETLLCGPLPPFSFSWVWVPVTISFLLFTPCHLCLLLCLLCHDWQYFSVTEFEPSLVYIASFKPIRDVQRNPLSLILILILTLTLTLTLILKTSNLRNGLFSSQDQVIVCYCRKIKAGTWNG